MNEISTANSSRSKPLTIFNREFVAAGTRNLSLSLIRSIVETRSSIQFNLLVQHIAAFAMIFLFIFTAVLLLLFHHYWTNRRLYKLSSQMPGPLVLPFIGNAYSTLGVSNEQIYDYFQYLNNSYEKPMRFWLGPKLFVLVSAPEDMQAILNSQECLSRDDVYDYIRCFTGDGLVTLRGKRERERQGGFKKY